MKPVLLGMILSLALTFSQANATESSSTEVIGEGDFQVTLQDAEKAIAHLLEEDGAADIVSATITNYRNPTLYRHKRPLSIGVKTLEFDDATGRWSANLFILEDEAVLSAMPVSGRYEEMLMVPIIKHRMHNGDIITAEDLDQIAYAADRVRKDTIIDVRKIIGKTPRRLISKNRPVRVDELQDPDVLAKGNMVHMRYHTPFMKISTIGEALEDGALGDQIRVKNHDSGTIIQARISSANEVIVGSPVHVE